MATVINPDFSYPTNLEEGQVSFLRPVRGASFSGMAAFANHLLGWRSRRAVHHIVDWSRDETASHEGNVAFQDTDAVSHTTYVWWKSHALAKYAEVMIRYQAHNRGSAPSQSIQATLSVKGGAVIDSVGGGAGVQWVMDNGLVGFERDGDPNGNSPRKYYPISFATTGGVADTDTDAALDPDFPRPLAIGSNGGSWLELKLVAVAVRILSVDVRELATPQVEV
jgi:hypothetical protein